MFLALAFTVLASAVTPLAARAGESFEADCAVARAGRQEALVEFATWCHDNKLFASRNRAAEQILETDPDHVGARRWLKHKLVAGGSWEAPTRPARATDRNDVALASLPVEKARILGRIARGLRQALETHAESVSAGEREAVLSEILDLTPSDKEVRREHGDVRTAKGWRLAETLRAAERRMELASAARAALEDVEEPRKVDVPGPAAASGLRFVGAWRTDNVLVTSTTTKNEAVTIARTIEATPAYLRVALGDSLRVIPGFTVYALSQRSDAKAVIDVHPSTDALTREHWTKFGAYWIGNQPQYLTYHTSPAWRLEATASQQIAFDLRERFGVAGDRAAWAAAGFEKRLAWDLVGTRITFSRRISEYAEQDVPWATWGDLTDGDWYRRARGVLAGYGPVDLAELFGKPLNLLTLPDEVVANAIAAYYLEGRPDECGAFLFALGQGENVDDALHKASGLDIVALRLRLLRWLDERNP